MLTSVERGLISIYRSSWLVDIYDELNVYGHICSTRLLVELSDAIVQ